MQERTIQLPGDGTSEYVTTAEAARYLALSDDSFEEIAQAEGWCRPVHHGRAKRWHVMDVFVLAYVWRQRQLTAGADTKK